MEIVVIGVGLLLIAGLGALGYAVVRRSSDTDPEIDAYLQRRMAELKRERAQNPRWPRKV